MDPKLCSNLLYSRTTKMLASIDIAKAASSEILIANFADVTCEISWRGCLL